MLDEVTLLDEGALLDAGPPLEDDELMEDVVLSDDPATQAVHITHAKKPMESVFMVPVVAAAPRDSNVDRTSPVGGSRQVGQHHRVAGAVVPTTLVPPLPAPREPREP